MSADLLRQAASLARELADKADAQPTVNVNVEGVWLNSRFYMVTTPERERAVADWLEDEADEMGVVCGCTTSQALAVARAYLGRES